MQSLFPHQSRDTVASGLQSARLQLSHNPGAPVGPTSPQMRLLNGEFEPRIFLDSLRGLSAR